MVDHIFRRLDPFRSIQEMLRDLTDSRTTSPIAICIGMVMDNNDPKDARRVKIRTYPYDAESGEDVIPFAWPMLPPHLWVEPEVGELMIVFFQNSKYPYRGRFYIGPILSSGEVDGQSFDDVLNDIWAGDKPERKIPGDEAQSQYSEGTPVDG